MTSTSSRLSDRTMIALAVACGAGSLALFILWPLEVVPLGLNDTSILLWDSLLSLAFFLQHSVMVRAPVRERLSRILPVRYLGAVYSIASGVVLTLVLLLWQRSPAMLVSSQGAVRWLVHALAVGGLAGFVWGAASLRGFDPLGLRPIKAHLRGAEPQTSTFTIRGAYRWVRHPLYISAIVLFWATPDITADRLLFNMLWTAWIVVATSLEEKDLVAEFGEPYREYRRRVPMVLPWHIPRHVEVRSSPR